MPDVICTSHVPDGITRSPLHLVQSSHEEAASRRQSVHSLHLPQMHLSAHHQTGAEASDTSPIAPEERLKFHC